MEDASKMGSCWGGSDLLAYEYIHTNGITDESCMPYEGVDASNWGEDAAIARMCRVCDRFGKCSYTNATTMVNVSKYGSVLGEEDMMAEILHRGPIACSLYAHSESFENYHGGIIQDRTKYPGTTHVVALVGWGIQGGVKFWVGRNSFGSVWGEGYGFFRLERGVNSLNIEQNACNWAVPSDETIQSIISHNTFS